MRKATCLLIVSFFPAYILSAQAPVITSFAPVTGNPGKQVTITGINFNVTPNYNIVYFGATKGIVVSSTTTSISVLIPVGALYGPINVMNIDTRLYGTSKKYFTPTFSPKKTSLASKDFLSRLDFSSYGANPGSIAIGDYNSDGKADISVANDNSSQMVSYTNNALTGTIDTTSLIGPFYNNTGQRPQSIAFGDFDLNASLDFACANYGSNKILYYKTPSGDPQYTSFSGLGPIDVAIADINMDGKPDVISANALSFGVTVFQNTNITMEVLSFTQKADFVTGFQAMAVAAGDIDGDGKPDIVVANGNTDSTHGLSILRNTSTTGTISSSSFAPVVNFTTGRSPGDVALADIDGDGKLDVIVVNKKGNSISVLRNKSTMNKINAASFAPKVDFATGLTPKAIATGDLNGDGKVDIVVTNLKDNNISVIQNNAISGTINSSSLKPQFTLATGSQPYAVAIGDIDGDGRPDIEVANYGSNTFSIIKNESSAIGFNAVGQTLEDSALNFTESNSKAKINRFNATVFPNPAKDHVTLSMNHTHGNVAVIISDVLGNKIWEKQEVKDNIIQIPVYNLTAGIYFITIKDYLNTENLKLIKE